MCMWDNMVECTKGIMLGVIKKCIQYLGGVMVK